MIQITAPISPGSSGSPVLDPESGNVIGIATAADQYGQNLNFAISADAVRTAIAKGLPKTQEPSERELVQEAFRRAWQKLDDKDYLGARMFFDMALMLRPDSAKAYAGLGFANLGLKEYKASVDDLTKSIQLKPGAPAYGGRAMAYYFLRRYADAITDLTEAIRLEPTHPEFYRARSKAYDRLGNHVKAEEDRKKAKELMARSGTPAE